ncbi:type VI secretion system baseplate subunit TssK [Xanthobacter sp. DSM 24535]|uniref:type VI secretion system baseplate subunit TssK n=1 Tax=Roseixanthobacter psychrophilus TaxID=3119917 RepID=UPI0037295778
MNTNGKVVWSEGMFLRAQHFQQQDRYLERLVRQRVEGLCPFPFGLRALAINRDLLALGKFALDRCQGVFEDGTPFDIPEDHEHPEPIDLPVSLTDSVVYLCLPVRQRGAADVEVGGMRNSAARFGSEEMEVVDEISGSNNTARIRTAKLRLSLLLANQDRSGFHCLGLARVAEVGADRKVRLDPNYISPFLDASASPALSGFLNELTAMLHHRGEALAPRVTGSDSHGVAEIADFLMLQVINRAEPHLAHLARLSALHPERLYATFLELAGELATFTAVQKRPRDFAVYRHDNLEETFEPVMVELRRSLSAVLEQSAVQIPLLDRKYGIRVGTIQDRSLISGANFVLVVKADMPGETIRRSLPALIKIGPVEQIRELVNVQLPGIRVRPLALAPRQIPYNAGAVYFELEPASPLWKQLAVSGGIAVHLAGDFPGVHMEMWAIRN